ncbi:MAG: carboxypeptidase regulatory-like domain-containing protein [Methanonatronarchaeia archaeon]|nr:MAG: carboxypeptidase regulatory-like domain-containing protein [Methanonatronarchaeia archaeon]
MDFGKIRIDVGYSGEKIKNANVKILEDKSIIKNKKTSDKGVVEEVLPYGNYRVVVSKKGFEEKDINLDINKDILISEIELNPKPVKTKIQIINFDGEPIDGMNISIQDSESFENISKTNESGIAYVELFPGDYEVLLSNDDDLFHGSLNVRNVGSENRFRIKLLNNIN